MSDCVWVDEETADVWTDGQHTGVHHGRHPGINCVPGGPCGVMLQNDLTHWMEAPNSSSRRTNITPVQLLGLGIVEVQTEEVYWCPEEGQGLQW